MTSLDVARQRPLVTFFALAYGLSWGGILMVLGTTGFDLTVLRPWDAGLVFVAMLLGPSVAGLTMTGLLGGRSALRGLGGRRCHSQEADMQRKRSRMISIVISPLLGVAQISYQIASKRLAHDYLIWPSSARGNTSMTNRLRCSEEPTWLGEILRGDVLMGRTQPSDGAGSR